MSRYPLIPDLLHPVCERCTRQVCKIGAPGCGRTDRTGYYAEYYRRNRERKLAAAKERQRRVYRPKPRKRSLIKMQETVQ